MLLSSCFVSEERNFRNWTFAACVTQQTPMLAALLLSSLDIPSED